MAILTTDQQTKGTIGTDRGMIMDKRRSCANCSSTDHHVSACPAYKQGMRAIGFSLEDEDASELDHEDFMRGVIAKIRPEVFLL